MKKRKITIHWSILLCIFMTTSIAMFAQDGGIATYTISFDSTWSQETHPHPTGNLPSVSHWSDLVGVSHNNQVTFLAMGTPASTGVQNVAELGNSTVFFQEVQQAITENTAYNELDFGDLDTASGMIQGQFETRPEFPLLTVISMIAPSPDWMIAANSIALQDENGTWKEEIVMDLFPYDAGTDSGIDYTSEDQITSPVGVITSLEGISPFSTQKMGTLTITLDGVLGVEEQEIVDGFSIFPNPSSGIISIVNRDLITQQLSIYNTLGQLMHKTTVTDELKTIDLTPLGSGVYFLQRSSQEGKLFTERIVIK
ncbi:spondin domain-containing protein [Dokdonia pacifica]|uniref:Por secretion system C-terminal sorting domain-containing protein n=1 Tax=Dokdonia pacifica TaxID=1627892 RepID=A0A239AZ08_9FLAO|nr:spondin domain-containing protein [Dokdonia pacifica]SNS00966.1 Por secretion system C-terminal sorting domain-containing protein [Dokdonia pacifica]